MTRILPMNSHAACTVRDVIGAYLRHSVAVGLHCARALAEGEKTLGMFVEHIPQGDLPIGDYAVSECRAYHLSDWVESQPGWTSISTKRKRAGWIKSAFNWALEGERIDRNPFQKVKYGEAERRPDMPDEVFELLCREASKPYEKALRFMRMTGCRIGELCAAKWKHINFGEPGSWTIPKHKSRRFKRKEKVVAVIGQAQSLLRTILYENATAMFANLDPDTLKPNPESLIFRNTQGTAWTEVALGRNFLRIRKKVEKKAGIKIEASMHGIRHRYGTCAVANGAPIKLISHQLGHASVKTTEAFYVNLSNELEAVARAAELAMPKK